ncbi:cupredoxin domain-containing protein [Microbacterium sp.]|uniref:cupredoxin domain-containing protein n=1 Tax=Microbacterium sp. TaxID=51671 RepID=UPI003F96D647
MRKLALLLVMMLALAGCSASPTDDPDAPVQTVQVDAANMRFTPDAIEVPVGTRLVIELTNTDVSQMHDLVFDNGAAGEHLAPGASETIDVGVITEDIDGWCSISNHRAMGMTMTVTAVN